MSTLKSLSKYIYENSHKCISLKHAFQYNMHKATNIYKSNINDKLQIIGQHRTFSPNMCLMCDSSSKNRPFEVFSES